DALAAFEIAADGRMRLESLELLIGREVGVLVSEPDDEADGDLPILQVVKERPAVRARVERPARRMHHQPGLMAPGLHLPQLFQPDAVDLRISALAQPIALLELLAELAAAALGEERVLAVQLHAGLVGVGLLALAIDAEIAGRDAFDRLAVVEHLGRGEAREDLDARAFRFFREPAAYVAQAHDVVAMVLEAGRQ